MKKSILFIWMIITLTSVFRPEVYAISSFEQEKNEILNDTRQNKDKDTNDKPVSLQIDRTVASTLQLGFHADLSFEFELPLVIDNGPKRTRFTSRETIDQFKILFYFIISPNAP